MWPESGKIGESYETPENSAGWLGRLFPSLMYYSKSSPIVIRSAKEAQAGLYDRDAWASSSLEIFRNLESIGVRFHIENSAVLAKLKSPCVFVGNHMSTLETFVLPCMIQPHLEVTFVVKQSLMEYPVFNHVMRSCDPVVVNYKSRKADFRAMLIGGEERLKKGISMVVFPQGTRTTDFNPKTFNTLAIKIAKRASVPIVPIALRTDAWGSNGRWVRDFGKMRPSLPVHIAFGEPLHVEGYGRECQAQIIKFIDDRYRRWTEEVSIPEKW
jgi:1-acyl-sn-glycerol-3-phosphate acyltransferase